MDGHLQVRRQEPNITRGITTCKYNQYRAMFVYVKKSYISSNYSTYLSLEIYLNQKLRTLLTSNDCSLVFMHIHFSQVCIFWVRQHRTNKDHCFPFQFLQFLLQNLISL